MKKIGHGSYPLTRMRRNRTKLFSRELLKENRLSTHDIILPVFVTGGEKKTIPITTMPGVFIHSSDNILSTIEKAVNLGIKSIALFPNIDNSLKDFEGSYAIDENNLVCKTVKLIKDKFPDLGIICDVALDPYTTHGHDGIYSDGEILNDKTLEILCKQAVIQAHAGCDIIAPSDMMDGRILAIRKALESSGFHNTQIMSYAVKYSSSFYGPFRSAIGSLNNSKKIDKSTYQMDPSNIKEAVREVELDISEGADMIIIKPGMPYLDVLSNINHNFDIPIFSYQVSGEYSMICGYIDNQKNNRSNIILESLICFKRAGATGILTYFALEIAEIINSDNIG